jgi:hypothetical protein
MQPIRPCLCRITPASGASAQTPGAAPPKSAQSTATLLSPGAFARLVQPAPTTQAATSVVVDSQRPSLLSQAKTVVAQQAQAAPAKAPQQSYWSRNKWGILAVIGVGVGVFAGLIALGLGG